MTTEYYRDQTVKGNKYEEYIAWRLRERNVQRYLSKEAQLAHGDMCVDGIDIEVKLNTKIAEENGVFIEVAEKRVESRETWWPAGIKASAGFTYYLVGDYREAFLLSRQLLLDLATRRRIKTIPRLTSQGFKLYRIEAIRMASEIFYWPDRTRAGDVVDIEEELREVGRRAFGLRYDERGNLT